MADTSTKGPTLDLALEDLETIVRTVQDSDNGSKSSYSAVQKNLPKLNLHVLTYIRFLENHGYVEYDRVHDTIAATEAALSALEDQNLWRDQVRSALGQHLSLDDENDVIDFDVENILDGLGDMDSDSPTSGFSFQGSPFASSNDSADALIDFGAKPIDDATGPRVEVPDLASIPEPAHKPTPSTPTMTQDPLRERRFSTGNQRAVSPTDAGTQTSNFERLEEVGSGGMGTVYKARQVKLDRVVAIKEIKEIFDVFAGVQRSDIIARFTQIVQTQSRLIHPNIIQTIDLDTDARFPFVVMQLAPNGNLRRLIDMDGRPPLQIALKYFLQILHALSAAHDADVTHGGIKPENVVLDSAGNALLTDFGISQVVELDGSRANQVYVGVGTVAYMSPEQFRDPNASSVKSDVYSLGIMLYEMLTGKVPGRRSPMPSSFYPDIPRKLDDIFDRMSMDDQGDRYNNIDEILADLYSAKEVMKILDKRGGFVFLRDPIEHGATGLKVQLASFEEDDEPQPAVEEDDSEASEGSHDGELSEESSEPDEDESGDAEAQAEEGDDVLNKLDKYGKLFEDEDED